MAVSLRVLWWFARLLLMMCMLSFHAVSKPQDIPALPYLLGPRLVYMFQNNEYILDDAR